MAALSGWEPVSVRTVADRSHCERSQIDEEVAIDKISLGGVSSARVAVLAVETVPSIEWRHHRCGAEEEEDR